MLNFFKNSKPILEKMAEFYFINTPKLSKKD